VLSDSLLSAGGVSLTLEELDVLSLPPQAVVSKAIKIHGDRNLTNFFICPPVVQ